MTIIRTATLSDSKNLAALAEATFRDTFAEHNTIEDMNFHCESAYGETIQTREIAKSSSLTLVVENKNHLIAYAQLRWGFGPKCVKAEMPGEIQRLYVDKA